MANTKGAQQVPLYSVRSTTTTVPLHTSSSQQPAHACTACLQGEMVSWRQGSTTRPTHASTIAHRPPAVLEGAGFHSSQAAAMHIIRSYSIPWHLHAPFASLLMVTTTTSPARTLQVLHHGLPAGSSHACVRCSSYTAFPRCLAILMHCMDDDATKKHYGRDTRYHHNTTKLNHMHAGPASTLV